MAYSNWGGRAYKNGEDVTYRKCDVPVFGDQSQEESVGHGARIWVNLLKNKDKETPWWQHAQHCVLGDGLVRLVGYKSYAHVYVVDGEEVKEVDIPFPESCKKSYFDKEKNENVAYYDTYDLRESGEPIEFEVNGHQITIYYWCDPEKVTLKLVEPDGTVWEGFSGYAMGAGWDD